MWLVLAERLVWALTKGQVIRRERLTGAGDGAHLTQG